MITLDDITRKWRFYRTALATCFFLNVLCIMTGMVLSVDHWRTALKTDANQTQLFDRLDAADRIQVAIQNLRLPKKDATLEFENWSEIKIQLQVIGSEAFPLAALSSNETKSAYLNRLETEMRDKKSMWMSEWRKSRVRDSHVVRTIIVISALALLFGLVLPLYCFSRITRVLVRTKNDIHKAAQNIVSEWLKAAHRYGEKPFRSVEFWLHIVLIAATYLGTSSRHPAAQVAGELAHLVRAELKKSGIEFDSDVRPRA